MDSYDVFVDGASWSDDEFDNHQTETNVFDPILELFENENNQEENPISRDILPDDLHERILACLPLPDILKASCVYKKWNQIVNRNKFTLKDANDLSKKTWYFMFSSSNESVGRLYDPVLRKWYNFELPFRIHHTWVIASSYGLVCFMDEECSDNVHICNPITRVYETLENPPSLGFSVYNTLAFSFDRSQPNPKYTVSVVRCMQAFEDFLVWDVSIHVYKSTERKWSHPVIRTMVGWRPGNVSVICDNVLYILVFCTRTGGIQNFHGLVTYNLDGDQDAIEQITQVPCPLTCGRLINVQQKLVLVGGIERRRRPGVIKGIGIWALQGTEWEEITKMPNKFVQGFGELDDVFACSGGGDLIYIQSYSGTALLVYDMSSRQWFWAQKCRMLKKFSLQMFTGFCFEPLPRFHL